MVHLFAWLEEHLAEQHRNEFETGRKALEFRRRYRSEQMILIRVLASGHLICRSPIVQICEVISTPIPRYPVKQQA